MFTNKIRIKQNSQITEIPTASLTIAELRPILIARNYTLKTILVSPAYNHQFANNQIIIADAYGKKFYLPITNMGINQEQSIVFIDSKMFNLLGLAY